MNRRIFFQAAAAAGLGAVGVEAKQQGRPAEFLADLERELLNGKHIELRMVQIEQEAGPVLVAYISEK